MIYVPSNPTCTLVLVCLLMRAPVGPRTLARTNERARTHTTHTHTHTHSAPHLPGTVQAGLPKPDNLKELVYRGKVTVSKFSKVSIQT